MLALVHLLPQGIEDHFLEQWHQKLHTNTTPEDITICEAYLAFLHSGSMDDFWRVAWDNGRITPESLATMDHPITGQRLCFLVKSCCMHAPRKYLKRSRFCKHTP